MTARRYRSAALATGSGAAAESGDPEADQLIGAVLLASRALLGIAVRSLAAVPGHVTLVQYRMLVLLAARGPQTPSALAGELAVAPSSVTRLSDRLVGKGLIQRHTPPDNRRQVVLSISGTGRSVVDSVTVSRRAEIERMLSAVAPARRLGLIDALNELSRAAGEPPSDAGWLGWEL